MMPTVCPRSSRMKFDPPPNSWRALTHLRWLWPAMMMRCSWWKSAIVVETVCSEMAETCMPEAEAAMRGWSSGRLVKNSCSSSALIPAYRPVCGEKVSAGCGRRWRHAQLRPSCVGLCKLRS